MLDKCFNINDLHTLAKKRLPGPIYDYMAGGADDEVALAGMFEFARKPRWDYNYLRDNGRDLANHDGALPGNSDVGAVA